MINNYSGINSTLGELHIPLSKGIFKDKAPAKYIVNMPLTDSFALHADNVPGFDIQEARIALYEAEQQHNICGIVVLQDGQLKYQDYRYGFQPADTVHVMPMTKNIVSLLTGIALDQGLPADIQQPVLDFIPDYMINAAKKAFRR